MDMCWFLFGLPTMNSFFFSFQISIKLFSFLHCNGQMSKMGTFIWSNAFLLADSCLRQNGRSL